jgi:hypothetical protein
MSHHHITPFTQPRVRATAKLPHGQFGVLTGAYVQSSPFSRRGDTNPNHIFLTIRVPSGDFAGEYECAFDTQGRGEGESQVLVIEQAADNSPEFGFTTDASLSYSGLQLNAANFQPVTKMDLGSMIADWADRSSAMIVYGFTYDTGDGIHDVHMNSGEPEGSGHANHPNQDGAILFYYAGADGVQATQKWVFTKFPDQHL